jgi:MFS family permease
MSGTWIPAFPGRSRYIAGLVVEATARGLYLPLSIIYFHVAGGMSLPVVGLGLTIAGVVGLVGSPIGGTLIDRIGALPVVVGCYVVRAAGFTGYLFVDSLPALILVAGLVSVSDKSHVPAMQALISELLSGVRRERLLALQRTIRNAGIALGGLLAASLLTTRERTGLYLVIIGCGVGFLMSALLLIGLGRTVAGHRPQRPELPIGYRTVLRDRQFVALSLNNVPFAFSYQVLNGLLPIFVVYVLDLSASVAGLLVATNAVLVVVAQLPVSRLQEPYRRTRGAALGGLLFALSFFGLAALQWVPAGIATVAVLWAMLLLYTGGELVHTTPSRSLAADVGPAAARGRYLSVYQVSYSIAAVLAPSVFTAALSLPSSLVWIVLGLAVSAAAAGLIRLERRLPAIAVSPPAEHPDAARPATATPPRTAPLGTTPLGKGVR